MNVELVSRAAAGEWDRLLKQEATQEPDAAFVLPDGTIQPEFVKRLQAIGKWMDRNSESIYGTTYGPIQGVPSVRTTTKGREMIVHLFELRGATIELMATGLPKYTSARLLATCQPVEFQQNDRGVTIKLPVQAPDPDVTVIAMKGM